MCVTGLVVAVVMFTLAGSLWQREERATVTSAITAALALLTFIPGPPPGVIGLLLLRTRRYFGKSPPSDSSSPPTTPFPRRELLIAAAGTAATVVATRTTISSPPPLRLAGWREFFLDAEQREQAWWHGIRISPTFLELPGAQLLAPATDLTRFDAVTCPSSYLADRLDDRVQAKDGKLFRKTRITTERMVVLGRTSLLNALITARIVVRSHRGEVWFDFARYINGCRSTWRSQDPELDSDELITLFAPDPTTSNAGQNFLLALATAYRNDPSHAHSPDLASLWTGDGPLARHQRLHSLDLWQQLPSFGRFGLIYAYEHDARNTLALANSDAGDYFMISTRPETVVSQYVIALTEAGLVLTRYLSAPKTRQQMAQALNLPPTGDRQLTPGPAKPSPMFSLADLAQLGKRPPDLVDWGSLPIRVRDEEIDKVYSQYLARPVTS
jgi:hypothetical protein